MAKKKLGLAGAMKTTMVWARNAQVAAFWVLVVLCVSPLIATANLTVGSFTQPLFIFALLDAYHLHFALNMGLGMLAIVVLAVWASSLCFELGIRRAFKELFKNKWAPLLLASVFWLSVSTLINCSSPEAAFMGDEYRLEGIFSLLAYMGFTACALIVDHKRKRALLLAFWAVSAIMGVLYLVQIAGIGMLANLNDNGFCVIFGNINHHAYYVAMGLMAAAGLFVYEKRIVLRVASAAAVVFLSVCLIVNGSFGPFLASAFALVFLAVIVLIRDGKGKLVALVPLALFLCVSLVNVAGFNYNAALSGIAQSTPSQEEVVVPES